MIDLSCLVYSFGGEGGEVLVVVGCLYDRVWWVGGWVGGQVSR